MKGVVFFIGIFAVFISCNKSTDENTAKTTPSPTIIKYPYTDTFMGVMHDTEKHYLEYLRDTAFVSVVYAKHDYYMIDGVNTFFITFNVAVMNIKEISYSYSTDFATRIDDITVIDSGKTSYRCSNGIFRITNDTLTCSLGNEWDDGSCGADRYYFYTKFIGIKKK